MWYIYTVDFSHKKEWNDAICSNMDGTRGYHTKWSQSDRGNQIAHGIAYICGILKMVQMSLFTKQK